MSWSNARPSRLRRFSSYSFPRPFKFHLGASFAGKPPDAELIQARSQGRFPSDSAVGSWRNKTLQRRKAVQTEDAGQDFFYIQEMRNSSGTSFGVADGVGGWVSYGIDPSLFSQALMFHAARYARDGWAGEPESEPDADLLSTPVEGWELYPKHCLELSYQAVLRERLIQSGSSTACVLTLSARTGRLRAANLGDSGFLIIRGSSIIHMQRPQTHSFNFPWQLAKLPISNRRTQEDFTDYPHEADEYSTSLRGGDVVVAFTDGLTDNVFPAEILSIVSLVTRSVQNETRQAQDLADQLIYYALACMHSRDKISPFQRSASQSGLYHRGGKIDDVTVVTAVVTEDA